MASDGVPHSEESEARAGSVTHSLGQVADDWAAIDVWLAAVAGNSPNGSGQTITTYRYHLAKLRWYCDTVCRLSPSHWSMQEVQAFKAFLSDLPDFAISARDVLEDAGAGGPFRKRPSASSQGDIMRFVSAMFTALHGTGYIARDPTALLKNRKPKRLDKTRTVDLDVFAEVLAGMDPHHGAATTASRQYRRDRFVLIALRELGLRASELVGAAMASVYRLSDPATGKSYRVIKVSDESAKDGTGRTVPMTKTAMDALVAYRIEFGLPPCQARRIAIGCCCRRGRRRWRWVSGPSRPRATYAISGNGAVSTRATVSTGSSKDACVMPRRHLTGGASTTRLSGCARHRRTGCVIR